MTTNNPQETPQRSAWEKHLDACGQCRRARLTVESRGEPTQSDFIIGGRVRILTAEPPNQAVVGRVGIVVALPSTYPFGVKVYCGEVVRALGQIGDVVIQFHPSRLERADLVTEKPE